MTLRPLRFAASVTASLAALGLGAALTLMPGTPVQADEGMWTFDNFPIARVNAQYGTNIDQAWLDRVRLASVRLQGCSA
ncbi:MAG: S46 family peptidase, partial [Brevundimonas sp.]|nr:S46 family peptidase [Brevundimonas sp.]